jgi:hypothetical protein
MHDMQVRGFRERQRSCHLHYLDIQTMARFKFLWRVTIIDIHGREVRLCFDEPDGAGTLAQQVHVVTGEKAI